MARKAEVYLDTSALIAFLDRSDSYHPLFARLFSEPPPLLTSALVVAEGHGWFLRRYDARRAVEFLAFLQVLPGFTIAAFDASAARKAGSVVRRFSDQKLTMADAHGLSLMTERKIKSCWSTDRHLSRCGARLVI